MLRRGTKKFLGTLILVVAVVAIIIGYSFLGAPTNFPIKATFLINEGESIKSVSARLQEEGYIKSALLFRLFLSGYDHDRKLQLGYYQFDDVEALPALVHNIITNGPAFPFGKLTVPEGSTDEDIAKLISSALPNLPESDILRQIQILNATGFLFPETYYLVPSMNSEEILMRMQAMFLKKTSILFQDTITALDRDSKSKVMDVVILASILEGEAKTKEDMKIISGILQKRLKIGMALQVDVAKETYRVRGLPKAPINNPGLNALDAVLHPTDSQFLYYITGNDGKMYYAKTFTEHKKNIQKYLK